MPVADKTPKNLTLHLLMIEEHIKNRAKSNVAVASAFHAHSKNKGGTSSSRKEYAVEERAAWWKEINDKKNRTCYQKCGSIGHWDGEYTTLEADQKAYQDSQQGAKEAAQDVQPGRGNTYKAFTVSSVTSICECNFWFVDSGSTEHMCHDLSAFSTFTNLSHEQGFVEGIGSTMLQVMGIGDIIIKINDVNPTCYGVLQGVIHTHNLGHNLFSTFVATQCKMYTLHRESGCHFIETRKIIIHGSSSMSSSQSTLALP